MDDRADLLYGDPPGICIAAQMVVVGLVQHLIYHRTAGDHTQEIIPCGDAGAVPWTQYDDQNSYAYRDSLDVIH